MKHRTSKYFSSMKSCDMFSHPISVNYKGTNSYPTLTGTFVSLILIILMAINFVVLTSEFVTGGNNNFNTSFEQFNRHASDKYYFKDQDFEISAFIMNDIDIVDSNVV